MEDIGPCLPYTDLLFVNDSEAEMLTGSDRSFRGGADPSSSRRQGCSGENRPRGLYRVRTATPSTRYPDSP